MTVRFLFTNFCLQLRFSEKGKTTSQNLSHLENESTFQKLSHLENEITFQNFSHLGNESTF